jgi:hypothetical protein
MSVAVSSHSEKKWAANMYEVGFERFKLATDIVQHRQGKAVFGVQWKWRGDYFEYPSPPTIGCRHERGKENEFVPVG